MSDSATTDSGADNELKVRLDALTDAGAQHFDPVRFHIISTLAEKSSGLGGGAAAHLRQRAWGKLQVYQADIERIQQGAAAQLETIDRLFPENREAAEQVLARTGIEGLQRFLDRLQSTCQDTPLQQLCKQLQGKESLPLDAEPEPSPGDYLRKQELELTTRHKPDGEPHRNNAPAPLKSAQLCRDALSQLEAEHLVTQASQTAPEDSGPLNPHKLAIRSLTTVREISPGYLGRLVSYLDNLSWLENN